MLDLGERVSLDDDNLPSALYLSPVHISPLSNDGNFMFVGIGVRKVQIFGCACLKHK